MAINVERTPNPAAMKFTVGAAVGGPATFTDPDTSDEPYASILALPGVKSAFATADFVTVSGESDVDWDAVVPQVVSILESAFA